MSPSHVVSARVRLPDELLAAVERRAQDLRISRNRYIVRALEQSLRNETDWSPLFVEELREARDDAEDERVLAELRCAIKANRRSKGPPAR